MPCAHDTALPPPLCLAPRIIHQRTYIKRAYAWYFSAYIVEKLENLSGASRFFPPPPFLFYFFFPPGKTSETRARARLFVPPRSSRFPSEFSDTDNAAHTACVSFRWRVLSPALAEQLPPLSLISFNESKVFVRALSRRGQLSVRSSAAAVVVGPLIEIRRNYFMRICKNAGFISKIKFLM